MKRASLLTLLLLLISILSFAQRQQKVGLVLSGGGARGLAHIGAIKALEDNNIPIENFLLYKNSQLEYTSEEAYIGESSIFDTTGKLIANLGSQPFNVGKNIIRINQPLPTGIYILTIKSGHEQLSYKFIVE